MILGNPAGLWVLTGIPAVLAIHLLQQRRRPVLITTLFLLPPRATPSRSGRHLTRLRSSVSLWLQLPAVLALTWLISAPRFARMDSVLKVAIVLDSTASLSAFRAPALSALDGRVHSLAARAQHVEWTLVESAPDVPALYSGRDAAQLLTAAQAWDPWRPGHDLQPALLSARELVGGDGVVVLITDHAREQRVEEELVAIGAPRDNVGLAAGDVVLIEDAPAWRAVVKNYGRGPAKRRLTVEVEGRMHEAQDLRLNSGELRVLTGRFPPRARRIELVLSADAFTLDDRLPLVVPRLKPLKVFVALPQEERGIVERFLAATAAVERVTAAAAADLAFVPFPNFEARSVVVLPLASAMGDAPKTRARPIAAASHPLTRDLDWRGLLVSGSPVPEAWRKEDVSVLLWRGGEPLLTLKGERQLTFEFAPSRSNADRLAAFPLVLHRFVEGARRRAGGQEWTNFETGQPLDVALPLVRETLEIRTAAGVREVERLSDLSAPPHPGFFSVVEGETPRIEGAAQFADAREADLTQAASAVVGGASGRVIALRHSRPDPYASVVLLVLLSLVVSDFWFRLSGAGA